MQVKGEVTKTFYAKISTIGRTRCPTSHHDQGDRALKDIHR